MTYRTVVHGADLARRLMDEGFRICPRDNPEIEHVCLGRPGREEPTQIIVIHRNGIVTASGTNKRAAARVLARLGPQWVVKAARHA